MQFSAILALGLPMGMEWIVIGVLALLLFGRRLPEVSRSLGRSVIEFKKGLKGSDEEIERTDGAEKLPPPQDPKEK